MISGESLPAAVSRADVEDAQRLLAGVTRLTPLQESRLLSGRVGGPVLLKCENLQRTGAFKLRGAYVRIARMDAQDRARGVVAASAGNHAQGVALAASLLGCQSTVVMPDTAPPPKVSATPAYGATVWLSATTVVDSLAAAAAWARDTGAVVVHPVDDVGVIARHCNLRLEIVGPWPP